MNKNIFLAIILSTFGALFAQPDWEDNPGGYQFTSYLVVGIVQSDGENIAESGDLFAAFDAAGNVRGVAVQLIAPFGLYEGQTYYEMTMRSNDDGDILSFQYYDASEDAVLDIADTYTFVTNDQLGHLITGAEFFNIGSGAENYPNWQRRL